MGYVKFVPTEVSNGSQNTQRDRKVSEKNRQEKELKLKYNYVLAFKWGLNLQLHVGDLHVFKW